MFISLRTPKTYLLFGVMKLVIKLPPIVPFLAYSLLGVPSPKETGEEGKGEAVHVFVSLHVFADLSRGSEGPAGQMIS